MNKNKSLAHGEIVRARDILGFLPEALFRVGSVSDGLVSLSAGEIQLMVNAAMLEVIERDLPEPSSWLATEVAVLERQVETCGKPFPQVEGTPRMAFARTGAIA